MPGRGQATGRSRDDLRDDPGEIDPYTVVPKGYRSLVAVRLCDRHRMSVICIEVRRKVPYRVMDLAGPGAHRRLVVDVAHRR